MHFADGTDRSCLHQFDHATVVVACMNLVPHLGGHPRLARFPRHDPRFGDGVGQRLLAINRAPALERGHRDDRMVVIGSAHHHRIDISFLQQSPKICEPFRRRKLLPRLGKIARIHVAESHDIFTRNAFQVIAAAIRHADDSDIEFFVCGKAPCRPAGRQVNTCRGE